MLRLLFCLGALLTSLPAAAPPPRVWILTTGGTIASVYDPVKKGFSPALSGEQLVASVPELERLASVELENFASIASSDITPELWLRLSRRVNALLAEPGTAGVVITHGTDSLEETAYFLDLTVTHSKPVVLVGAQRAASIKDSDGPRNLLAAVRVAVSPQAVGQGVLVVMNDEINAAREVTKTSTLDVGTFRSLEFGALGYAGAAGVRFYRAPARRQTIPLPPDAKLGRVEIVPHYAGADGSLILALLREGNLDGLVVAGLGLGHVSTAMAGAIAEVRRQGIPVVISTRVPTGPVLPLYSGVGGGVGLAQIGCVHADNLPPHKARIVLLLALLRTRDAAELAAYFSP